MDTACVPPRAGCRKMSNFSLCPGQSWPRSAPCPSVPPTPPQRILGTQSSASPQISPGQGWREGSRSPEAAPHRGVPRDPRPQSIPLPVGVSPGVGALPAPGPGPPGELQLAGGGPGRGRSQLHGSQGHIPGIAASCAVGAGKGHPCAGGRLPGPPAGQGTQLAPRHQAQAPAQPGSSSTQRPARMGWFL